MVKFVLAAYSVYVAFGRTSRGFRCYVLSLRCAQKISSHGMWNCMRLSNYRDFVCRQFTKIRRANTERGQTSAGVGTIKTKRGAYGKENTKQSSWIHCDARRSNTPCVSLCKTNSIASKLHFTRAWLIASPTNMTDFLWRMRNRCEHERKRMSLHPIEHFFLNFKCKAIENSIR